MKELLMGCGSRMDKIIEISKGWHDLTRLDNNPSHKPDVVWDLRNHPLPFADETFDEIHAYEVLEHLANQGDYEFFFKEFTEYARILKPGGYFCGSVPTGAWTWGDPSHKRVITHETLTFLDQDDYAQVGTTTMSDFRNIYKADFKLIFSKQDESGYYFVLQKPLA